MNRNPKTGPPPGPVILTVDGSTGRISPAVVGVTLIDEKPEPLVFANQSPEWVTVVLPHGMSPDGTIFPVAPGESIRVPILVTAALRNIEIPYGAFFYHPDGGGVRDWGKAASPPTMVVGP